MFIFIKVFFLLSLYIMLVGCTKSIFTEPHLFYTENRPNEKLNLLIPGGQITKPEYVIQHGEPVSIIVQAIYIPTNYDWIDGGDIVLTMDFQTTPTGDKVEKLAVHYQADVSSNSALGISNITVHNIPKYDTAIAPYFRIRLIDLDKPDNKMTQDMLKNIGGAADLLNSFYPNPYLPAFQTALEIGKFIVNNNDDDIIMDYKFQLYNHIAPKDTGDATIGILQTGTWIALGIPDDEKEREKFWKGKFYWDANQSRVVDEKGKVLKVPVVAFLIRRESKVVPAEIQKRSAEITALIEKSQNNVEIDELNNGLRKIKSAYYTMKTLQKLSDSNNNIDSLREAINNLESPDIIESDKTTIMSQLRHRTKQNHNTIEQWKSYLSKL